MTTSPSKLGACGHELHRPAVVRARAMRARCQVFFLAVVRKPDNMYAGQSKVLPPIVPNSRMPQNAD